MARYRQITQHICFGLISLPFGTVLSLVAMSCMLGRLTEIRLPEKEED